MAVQRPTFEKLPLRQGDPKGSAWGLWGEKDELGTLNLLTPDVVKNASKQVITGDTIPLNLPLNAFVRPMNPVRKPCSHNILAKGHANDDEVGLVTLFSHSGPWHILKIIGQLDMNTQGSSHWDGLRHYPYQETLLYYNGVTQAAISGDKASNELGIQNLATKTITGRGVLLDWFSWSQRNNITIDHFKVHAIPLSQLLAVAEEQNIQFEQGDILIIRTGWLHSYSKLTIEEQAALPDRPVRASCGVEASEEAIRWYWDNAFAAVASDTVAYEAWPSPKPWGVSMHEVFLSGWGMPIGESFDLEALAEKCEKESRWTFLLVSVPLNVPAGVASPPGAVAIF